MKDSKVYTSEEFINGFKVTVTRPKLSETEYLEAEKNIAERVVCCLSGGDTDRSIHSKQPANKEAGM